MKLAREWREPLCGNALNILQDAAPGAPDPTIKCFATRVGWVGKYDASEHSKRRLLYLAGRVSSTNNAGIRRTLRGNRDSPRHETIRKRSRIHRDEVLARLRTTRYLSSYVYREYHIRSLLQDIDLPRASGFWRETKLASFLLTYLTSQIRAYKYSMQSTQFPDRSSRGPVKSLPTTPTVVVTGYHFIISRASKQNGEMDVRRVPSRNNFVRG